MLRSAIGLLLAINAPATIPKINKQITRDLRTLAVNHNAPIGPWPEILIRERLEEIHCDLIFRLTQHPGECPCSIDKYLEIQREVENETLAHNILRLAAKLYSHDPIVHRDLVRYRNYETVERFLGDIQYGEKKFDN